MMKKLMSLLVLAVFGVGLQAAQAQALRVGYTDHELIIVNMPDYLTIQEQLQQDFQSSQQELQEMAQGFQEKVERYQKQQALLSEESRQEREQELQQLQQELQQAASEKEQGLASREAELLRPILERVQTAIDEVAKQKNLDIVLRSQINPGAPVILYVNEDTIEDITMDVARKLGLDVSDETASN